MSRLVRCPKCSKLLVENSTVPLNQCGGCGTVLRAKSYNISRENATREPTPINSNQESQSEIGISDIESASVNRMSIASSSSVNNVNERRMVLDHNPAHLIIDDNCNKNGEGLEPNKEKIESSISLDFSISKQESPIESEHYVDDQANKEYSINEQVNVFLRADKHGSNYLKMTSEVGESSNSFSNSMASEEDLADTLQSNGRDDVLKSPATMMSSHAYESSNSSEDGHTIDAPNWQLPKSRRTFRHQRPPKGKEQENPLGRKNMAAYNELRTCLPTSSNEQPVIDVERDLLLLNYESGAHERGKSFDSTESQSVHNWTLEKGSVSPRSLEEDSHIGGDTQNREELLRKFDELRVQSTELYAKRSPSGCIHEIQKSSPSLYHHHQGSSYGQSPQCLRHTQEMPLPGYAQCTCLQCKREQQKISSHHQNRAYRTSVNDVRSHSSIEHDSENPYFNDRPKHYCQPISGASPFVICYNCDRLLQLPTDVLISMKKLHKLQCAACNEVLMFSFPDLANSNPETPSRSVHSPTEVDTVRNGLNYSTNDDPQEYPNYYFHDYGTSAKSYSGELPLHVSRKTYEQLHAKGKGPLQLHRPMGYGSASELLYQREDSDEGYESSEILIQHSRSSNEIYASTKLTGSARSTLHSAQTRDTNSPVSVVIHEEGGSSRSSRTGGARLPRPGMLEDRRK